MTNGLDSYSVVPRDGAGYASALGKSCKRIAAEQRKENAVFLGMKSGWRRNASPVSSSRLQDRNYTGTVYNCALRSKGIICFSRPRCVFSDRPALPRSSRQDGERRWLRVRRSSRDSFCRNIFSQFSSCRIFFFPFSAPPPITYLISLPQ